MPYEDCLRLCVRLYRYCPPPFVCVNLWPAMSAVCSSLESALSLPNDWTWEWGKAAPLCPVDWEGSMPLGPPICQIHQFLTKMTCRRDLALRFLSPDQGPTYSTDRPAVTACTLDFTHSPLLFFCHWQEDENGQTWSDQKYTVALPWTSEQGHRNSPNQKYITYNRPWWHFTH